MGMRGCGKSSIASQLSTRIRRTYVDLDTMTATRCNAATAGLAMARVGEAAFRAAELEALRTSLVSNRFVIALGGGTVMAPGAADLINATRAEKRSMVVYLRATAATLRERLEKTDLKARPSLTGKGVLEEIPDLLAQREPVYLSLADEIFDVDGKNLNDVVKAMAAMLKGRGIS
jgi:shikimate kinase